MQFSLSLFLVVWWLHLINSVFDKFSALSTWLDHQTEAVYYDNPVASQASFTNLVSGVMTCLKLELRFPLMYNEPRTVCNESWPRYNLSPNSSLLVKPNRFMSWKIFSPRLFYDRPEISFCTARVVQKIARSWKEARRENVPRRNEKKKEGLFPRLSLARLYLSVSARVRT